MRRPPVNNAMLEHLRGLWLSIEAARRVSGTRATETDTMRPVADAPTAPEIKAYLDAYVVGQEIAKKRVAAAMSRHLRASQSASPSEHRPASNILMIGPTGVGKTYIARTLASICDLPFASVNATEFTEVGFVGRDTTAILSRLVDAAGGNIARAQWGVVYIDEFDKLARDRDAPHAADRKREGVQQELLAYLEGKTVQIETTASNERLSFRRESCRFETHNVLFLCGGVFDGLNEIVRDRLLSAAQFESDVYRYARAADLIKYGLLPELAGRLPVIAPLGPLDDRALAAILEKEVDSPLTPWREWVGSYDKTLEMHPGAVNEVAHLASSLGIGARGIDSVLEALFLETIFEIDAIRDDRIAIDAEMVRRTWAEANPDPDATGTAT